MKKRIVIFSPSPYSLYTTSVCELLLRNNIEISCIVVKKFTLKRFIQEFRRDGKRLLKKIWNKLILKDRAYKNSQIKENIISFRDNEGIKTKSIFDFGIDVIQVDDLNNATVEKCLSEINIDLIVFTGGGLIRENIFNVAGQGVLNCHMGVLPEYRGMDVPEWAILENNPHKVGFTVHFMDKGVDTGDILKVFTIMPQKDETVKQLRERFEPLMVKGFVETIVDILDAKIVRKKQYLSEGKQYFIMHEKLLNKVNSKLKN